MIAKHPTKYANSTSRSAVILAVISVLCFVPVLWGPPSPSGDLIHHLQITKSYEATFAQGNFFPDLAGNENNGYGSITVRFYPPLIHVTVALIDLLVVRMDMAIFLAFCLWSFIGSLGAYLLAREVLGCGPGPLVAAFSFAITPYHLNQFYNSFMWGEYASLSVLPYAFFFVIRVCARHRVADIAALAVSLAAVILSNIPQAMVGFACLAIFVFFCLDRERLATQVSSLIASGLIAALGTSFYWYRVITEMHWLQISLSNSDPAYDYRNHFLFNSLELDPQGTWFASIILLLLLGSVAAVLPASGRFRSLLTDRKSLGVMAVFVFSVVMLLPISSPLWDRIDLLQRIQFPWRFLSPVSLMASLLIAHAIADLDQVAKRSRRPLTLVLTGVLLILTTFSTKQVVLGSVTTEREVFNQIADSSVSSLGLHHWWPVWANKDTFSDRNVVMAPGRAVEILKQSDTELEFSVSEGEPSTVRVARIYYPWWRVKINGQFVETKNLDGALSFDIGSARSHSSIFYEEPTSTGTARMISAMTWLSIFILVVISLLKRTPSYD